MVSRPAEPRRRPQKTRAARDHMPQSSAFDGPQGASHVEIMAKGASLPARRAGFDRIL